MILTAISLFLFPISSALEFSFNSPASAESEEPFTASISASVSSQYDVKIFIQDENKIIVSQIFNNGWKNPYYFLKSAFPNQTEFQVRSINASGNYQICARLRETGKTSFSEKCNNITITQSQKPQDPQESPAPKETPEESPMEKNKEEQNTKEQDAEISDKNNPQQELESINYPIQQNEKSNRIILGNPQPQKSPQSEVFATKYETTRNFILYSFTALCIIIIILLALKQL